MEDACKRLSGVVDAAVVVHADSLVAFVSGEALDSTSVLLKELNQQNLPAGHAPSDLKQMAALPVTTNGKIDRKRLMQSLKAPKAAAAPLLCRGLEAARELQVR